MKAEEAVEEVNIWAENASNGLIKDFLPSGSLNSETALVLANALYFKGTWDQEFDPSMTQLKDFHLINGLIVGVPYMTTERNVNHLYGSFDSYKVVQIPYKSGQESKKFSMYFFLPNEKDGLPNLILTLKFKSDFFYKKFKLRKVHRSEFWIPKFKFSFKFEASETMKEMGLKLPFMDGEVTEMLIVSLVINSMFQIYSTRHVLKSMRKTQKLRLSVHLYSNGVLVILIIEIHQASSLTILSCL